MRSVRGQTLDLAHEGLDPRDILHPAEGAEHRLPQQKQELSVYKYVSCSMNDCEDRVGRTFLTG